MTSDLEKQFFKTFGIEPKYIFRGCRLGAKYYAEICDETTCNGCDEEIRKTEYPQITDSILLELICVLSQHYSWEEQNWFIERTTIDELKEWLLEEFIEIDKIGLSKIIKHQVQALFKEER